MHMNIPLNISDDEIIRMIREHFEGLFPRVCPNCGRRYATLREYILDTKRIGATISYDAEMGDWETTQPIGAFALANCTCGSTIALSTEGIPLSQIHLLLKWVRTETERRGLSPRKLIDYVRDEVRKQVLADPVKDTHKD
jgi:UDP-N-acetylmuramyl tripeptide synthase